MENVTFLYTLADGVCSKSHGFYAAKVSGIKQEVFLIFDRYYFWHFTSCF